MEKRLHRIPHEGALAGVCAGLAEYFDIDKAWIRVFFVISVVFASAFGIGLFGALIYIVLWAVLPVKSAFPPGFFNSKGGENYPNDPMFGYGSSQPSGEKKQDPVDERSDAFSNSQATDFNTGYQDNFKKQPYDKPYADLFFEQQRKKKNSQRRAWGIFLLFIGMVFLLFQLDVLDFIDLRKYWPVALIVTGLFVISRSYTSLPRTNEGVPVSDSVEGDVDSISSDQDNFQEKSSDFNQNPNKNV